jgi:hypothetical protein
MRKLLEQRNNNNVNMIIKLQTLVLKEEWKLNWIANSVMGPFWVIRMFSNSQMRFFCCTACMAGYKKKYAGRIESIKRRFEEGEKSPNYADPLRV